MEFWKKVSGFEHRYQVSSLGNVRSFNMLINNKHGCKSRKKGRMLKQHQNKKGYMQVKLCVDGVCKSFRVHRLVAEAFIYNPYFKPQVNHKNGVKNDNSVENLEWVSNRENINHAYSKGLIKTNKGSNHHMSKLTEDKVRQIKMRLACESYSLIAKDFNVSTTTIGNIANNKVWKHVK